MKKTVAFLVLVSALGCGRGSGRQQLIGVVHAAEQPARWFKTEIPLTVYHDEMGKYRSASAEGFWQSTSADRDKQLVFPIAVRISCDYEEKVCREADATVQLGLLQAELTDYAISSWTRTGILADDSDQCNRHSLAIDFKSNSVTVTDYPIKTAQSGSACKPLHDSYSYALHGGQLQLYPPAPWDPLAKSDRETHK